MDWHDFLRAELARKLSSVEMLSARQITLFVSGKDVSEQAVADHLKHIAEIETILTDAGETLHA